MVIQSIFDFLIVLLKNDVSYIVTQELTYGVYIRNIISNNHRAKYLFIELYQSKAYTRLEAQSVARRSLIREAVVCNDGTMDCIGAHPIRCTD